MAKEEKNKEVEVITKHKLKTIDDILKAHEYVFNRQSSGKIDAKAADALNTTLKGVLGLKKLRLDAAKLFFQSQVKKVAMPEGMLEDLTNQLVEEAKS